VLGHQRHLAELQLLTRHCVVVLLLLQLLPCLTLLLLVPRSHAHCL
jgi:hypothetical protein